MPHSENLPPLNRDITEDDVSIELAARVLIKNKSLGTWHHPVIGTPYTIGPGPVIRALEKIAGKQVGATIHKAEPAQSLYNSVYTTFAFEAGSHENVLEEIDENFLCKCLPNDWRVSIVDPCNGFQVIEFSYNRSTAIPRDMLNLIEKRDLSRVRAHLENLEKIMDYPPTLKTQFVCVDHNDTLIVQFQYHDNKQICSAEIPREIWDARHATDISDEQVLMLAHQDIEISEVYDASDITVTDVYERVEHYQDPVA
jgi:hypothetical protein